MSGAFAWPAIGDRVAGAYLGHAFTGAVAEIEFDAVPEFRRYRIRFDQPIDVARPPLRNLRRAVQVRLASDGHSVDAKGRPDGLMQLANG